MKRPTILLVGGDLQAQARLSAAAARLGARWETAAPSELLDRLAELTPQALVIDLDRGGRPALDHIEEARERGLLGPTVLAFYSHVDTESADLARRVGIQAVPRGRFWSQLDRLLGAE